MPRIAAASVTLGARSRAYGCCRTDGCWLPAAGCCKLLACEISSSHKPLETRVHAVSSTVQASTRGPSVCLCLTVRGHDAVIQDVHA